MADAPTPKGTRLIDFAPPEVTDKLIKLQVGGCTCMTKSPELRFHDAWCTYRLATEVYDLLNTAPTPSPPVAAPPATPEYPPMPAPRVLDRYQLYRRVVEVEGYIADDLRAYLDAARAAQPQPQPAQPLTGACPLPDEQIWELAKPFITEIGGDHWNSGDDGIRDNGRIEEFARAVEAAHGITAPPEVAP